MKPILSILIATTAVSLLTTPHSSGQTTARSAGGAPSNKRQDALSSEDAKEKAEDATLLQQLESAPEPPSDSEPKSLMPRTFTRGGGMAGVAAVGVPYHVQNVFTRPVGSGAKALLVRTTDPDPKAQAELQEDLTVMSHILNKAIDELPGGQGHGAKVMGIDVFYSPTSTPLRSLYLDNYGAVFFLSVSFPLVASSEKPRAEEKPVTDSAWEDARQEVYGQRFQATVGGEPAEEYSQEKLDKLKEALLETLKNASNIRDLKPDEFVTLWVSGGAGGRGGRFRVVKHNPADTLGGNMVAVEQPVSGSRRTILTIRVSKAEIDAYANGKLSQEEFRKQARITTYTGDAQSGTVDSFMIGGAGGRARF